MGNISHLRIENPHRNHKFWHKVQVHCHSSESDAKRGQTPKVVEEAYRDAGYDCVFLTDHNRVTPDPGVSGLLHIDGAEHGLGRHHTLALGVTHAAQPGNSQNITRCACRHIEERLSHVAKAEKAIPVVAHPNARHFCSRLICPRFCGGGWSLRELQDHARHYAGLEIFNANNAARRMWGLNRWDDVLASTSQPVWGFASDDCHDFRDEKTFDRGFILVNSEIDPLDSQRGLANQAALRRDILANIRSGNFCAVVRLEARRPERRLTPPTPHSDLGLTVSSSGAQIRVSAGRPCESIEFTAASSSRREPSAAEGSAGFDYNIGGWENYVRARAVQKTEYGQRYMIFSQPLFVRPDET